MEDCEVVFCDNGDVCVYFSGNDDGVGYGVCGMFCG